MSREFEIMSPADLWNEASETGDVEKLFHAGSMTVHQKLREIADDPKAGVEPLEIDLDHFELAARFGWLPPGASPSAFAESLRREPPAQKAFLLAMIAQYDCLLEGLRSRSN